MYLDFIALDVERQIVTEKLKVERWKKVKDNLDQLLAEKARRAH